MRLRPKESAGVLALPPVLALSLSRGTGQSRNNGRTFGSSEKSIKRFRVARREKTSWLALRFSKGKIPVSSERSGAEQS